MDYQNSGCPLWDTKFRLTSLLGYTKKNSQDVGLSQMGNIVPIRVKIAKDQYHRLSEVSAVFYVNRYCLLKMMSHIC